MAFGFNAEKPTNIPTSSYDVRYMPPTKTAAKKNILPQFHEPRKNLANGELIVMVKKLELAALLAAAIGQSTQASASVQNYNISETFTDGTTFNGLFSYDTATNLIDSLSGTLNVAGGGSYAYGTPPLHNQIANDPNAATYTAYMEADNTYHSTFNFAVEIGSPTNALLNDGGAYVSYNAGGGTFSDNTLSSATITAAVPEPASLILLSTGLLGLCARKKSVQA